MSCVHLQAEPLLWAGIAHAQSLWQSRKFCFPPGLWITSLIYPPKNNICWCNWRMWLWLSSCPVPGWAGTHVSNTLTMSAEGSDAPKALAIGAFGRRCPSFLHICYQDSHRHRLNSKYIGNFFLHYIEECTQPGSYHSESFWEGGSPVWELKEMCSSSWCCSQASQSICFPDAEIDAEGLRYAHRTTELLHMCWGLKARKLKCDLLVTKLVWGPVWQEQGRICMKTAAVGTG